MADQDFNDDRKDAGDLGAGHSVTALYEIVPVGAKLDVDVGTVDPLKYQQHEGKTARESDDWFTVKFRYKEPTATASRLIEREMRGETRAPSADFRFAAAVAGVGMLLRDSEHKGSASFDGMLALAKGAKGEDEDGYRAEFIRLMETAALIDKGQSRGRELTGRR
jgi:Ca-activated chloride channel family protein